MFTCKLHVLQHVACDLLLKGKDGWVICKDLVDRVISDNIIAAHYIKDITHTWPVWSWQKQLMKKLKKDPKARYLLSSVGILSNLYLMKHNMKHIFLTKSYFNHQPPPPPPQIPIHCSTN